MTGAKITFHVNMLLVSHIQNTDYHDNVLAKIYCYTLV